MRLVGWNILREIDGRILSIWSWSWSFVRYTRRSELRDVDREAGSVV